MIKGSIYDIKTRLCKDNSIITRIIFECIDLDLDILNLLNKIQLSIKNKDRDIKLELDS